MEVMEMKNKSAMFKSAMTAPGAKGTTSQMVAAGINIAIGAARKIQRSDPLGDRFSLVNSFTTSAAGCRSPLGQTLLGPKRPWMYPATFRSDMVRIAARFRVRNNIAPKALRKRKGS
jgi:hypothetical protein